MLPANFLMADNHSPAKFLTFDQPLFSSNNTFNDELDLTYILKSKSTTNQLTTILSPKISFKSLIEHARVQNSLVHEIE